MSYKYVHAGMSEATHIFKGRLAKSVEYNIFLNNDVLDALVRIIKRTQTCPHLKFKNAAKNMNPATVTIVSDDLTVSVRKQTAVVLNA